MQWNEYRSSFFISIFVSVDIFVFSSMKGRIVFFLSHFSLYLFHSLYVVFFSLFRSTISSIGINTRIHSNFKNQILHSCNATFRNIFETIANGISRQLEPNPLRIKIFNFLFSQFAQWNHCREQHTDSSYIFTSRIHARSLKYIAQKKKKPT